MSGWLFADMLLVLAIVALGAMLASREAVDAYVGAANASPTPSPTESSSAPSPSPTPSKAAPPGLSKDPKSLTLRFDSGALLRRDPQTLANLRQQIKNQTESIKQRQAGFVLTFGGDSNPSRATDIAEIVNAQLVRVRPALFRGAVLRDFIRLSKSNSADVEIFLYR
jgi:hypothetical protein